MMKHGVGKLPSSLFGSHIDHQHSKLVEEKKGTEKMVEKILKLIEIEEKEDDLATGSELVSLVEEFHENYKELYGKYDSLVVTLRKFAHQKKVMNGDAGTSSDSDSSSSDSDGSSKSSKKNGKHREIELANDQNSAEQWDDLKTQVEELKKKNRELDMEAVSMHSKVEEDKHIEDKFKQQEEAMQNMRDELGRTKESFKDLELKHEILKVELKDIKLDASQRLGNAYEEKESLLSQKMQAENDFKLLKFEKASLEEVFNKLQSENQSLNLEIERLRKQVDVMDSQLMTVTGEKDELNSKLESALSRISESEKVAGDFKIQANVSLMLANEKSAENTQLVEENELLKQNIATLKRQREDLGQELFELKNEKNTLESEMSAVHAQMLHLQEVSEKLRMDCELFKDGEAKLVSDNANLTEELRVRCEELNVMSLKHAEDVEKLKVVEEQTKMLDSDLKSLGEVKSQLLNDYELLKQESGIAFAKMSELQVMLDGVTEKKHALEQKNEAISSELSSVLPRLNDAEKLIGELTAERDDLRESRLKLQNEILDLKLVNDGISEQVDNFRKDLAIMEEEKLTALKKLSSVDHLVEELECEIVNLRKEISQMSEELNARDESISSLNDKCSKLELEVEKEMITIAGQISDLHLLREAELKLLEMVDNLQQSLREKDEDNDALSKKYTESVDQCMLTEAHIQMLLEDLEKQKEQISNLLVDYEGMKEDFIASDNRVSELEGLLASTNEEKNDLSFVNAAYLEELEKLRKLADDLKAEADYLNQSNSEIYATIDGLSRKLEDIEDEKSILVAENLFKVGQMQNMLDDLEKQLDRKDEELSALQREYSDQEMTLNENKQMFKNMMLNHQSVKDQLQDSCKKLEAAQRTIEKLEEKAEVISWLEKVGEEQKREIGKLVENKKEVAEMLKQSELAKENAEKEFTRLKEQFELIEVQLISSNQKLKISETEYKEIEENYKKRIEALQEERGKLEDQITNLQGKTNCLEAVFEQIKEAVNKQLKMEGDLILAFERACKEHDFKLFKCYEEIQSVNERLVKLISKKEELEHENSEQLRKVGYMEGTVSTLKEEIGILQEKLALKVEEEEKLVKSVDGYKAMACELQEKVKKLEEEIIFKDEEKREAIRQLCVQIEYHRDNYERLYDLVSPKAKGNNSSVAVEW